MVLGGSTPIEVPTLSLIDTNDSIQQRAYDGGYILLFELGDPLYRIFSHVHFCFVAPYPMEQFVIQQWLTNKEVTATIFTLQKHLIDS